MEQFMALLIRLIPKIPDALANWLFPRVIKAMIDQVVAQFPIAPGVLGADLVAGFAADTSALDPEGPEVAAANILIAAIEEFGSTLTHAQIAPLMVKIGAKIVTAYP